MGKKDTLTKAYVSNPEVFADICNYALYGGRQIINATQLQEKDPVELSVVFRMADEEEISVPVQKVRDLLKSVTIMDGEKATYVLIGIENQSDIHYAMPVRNMLYDALNYSAQVNSIAKVRKKGDNKSSDYDFLTGLNKSDKLVPVITITVYYGSEGWDAPRSLYEMVNVPTELKEFVQDYKLNLVVPAEIADFNTFRTDIGCVFNLLKFPEKDNNWQMLFNSTDKYRHIDIDAVRIINELMNANIRVVANEGGKMDMCKAIENMLDRREASVLVRNVDTLAETVGYVKAFELLKISEEKYEEAKELLLEVIEA